MEQEKTKDNFCDSGEHITASENSHVMQRLALTHTSSQAAEQAEALCFSAILHDLIVFTLELPLLECIQEEKGSRSAASCPSRLPSQCGAERLRIFDRIAEHMAKTVSSCRWARTARALLGISTREGFTPFSCCVYCRAGTTSSSAPLWSCC